MSNQNDFNILPEEPGEPRWLSRPWLWVLLIAAIAIFAFAVGMAVSTFSNRVGNDNNTADALPTPTVIVTNAVVPTFTALPSTSPTATLLANIPPTPVGATATALAQAATVAPTPVHATNCPRSVYEALAAAYDANRLGCAVSDAGLVWSAWEAFERGAMFWRSDNNRTYAFFADSSWMPVNEGWNGQAAPSRGDPPPGLLVPERGFGYAWGIRDDFFQRLGWATDQERGFCAVIQNFERGFILQSSTVEFCQDNLYNHARAPEWKPLLLIVTNEGSWRNLAAGSSPGAPPPVPPTANPNLPTATPIVAATPVPLATPLPTATTIVDPGAQRPRPERNGIFTASSLAPQSIDGSLADWQGNWFPINTVVQGNNNYSGAGDIAGDFQVAWSRDGLYLAVRVRDDLYRAGPTGTDMWQGDSLELHLDRLLALDYDGAIADADDYQLGMSFGPDRNEVRLYRWLPFEKEGPVSGSGVVVAVDQGYDLEILLPWTLFDMGGNETVANQSFGFNLSISDNDADAPAQETVLSASPARTTYNNPTEWGTLILGN
jgi:Carbohydrate family 9 binding domain-like